MAALCWDCPSWRPRGVRAASSRSPRGVLAASSRRPRGVLAASSRRPRGVPACHGGRPQIVLGSSSDCPRIVLVVLKSSSNCPQIVFKSSSNRPQSSSSRPQSSSNRSTSSSGSSSDRPKSSPHVLRNVLTSAMHAFSVARCTLDLCVSANQPNQPLIPVVHCLCGMDTLMMLAATAVLRWPLPASIVHAPNARPSNICRPRASCPLGAPDVCEYLVSLGACSQRHNHQTSSPCCGNQCCLEKSSPCVSVTGS